MKRILVRRTETKPAAGSGGGLYFSEPKTNIEFIPSGCVLLDLVLGGGWPLGRVSNIVGDKSTGKTLLAIEAIANLSRSHPRARVRYAESESAFDPEYAAALGIELPESCITQFDTVERLFEDLSEFCSESKKARTPGLYIIDSLDALSDAAEMDRAIGEGSFGAAKAKQLSQMFRRCIRQIEEAKVCFIVISQVRDAIGVTFGDKHSRSGGRALDFYASIALWLAHLKQLKRTVNKVERVVGVSIRARCKKNKIGLPFRECELNIAFGYGIEEADSILSWLKEVGSEPKGKLTLQELRALAVKRWGEIERSFIRTDRKYGTDSENGGGPT